MSVLQSRKVVESRSLRVEAIGRIEEDLMVVRSNGRAFRISKIEGETVYSHVETLESARFFHSFHFVGEHYLLAEVGTGTFSQGWAVFDFRTREWRVEHLGRFADLGLLAVDPIGSRVAFCGNDDQHVDIAGVISGNTLRTFSSASPIDCSFDPSCTGSFVVAEEGDFDESLDTSPVHLVHHSREAKQHVASFVGEVVQTFFDACHIVVVEKSGAMSLLRLDDGERRPIANVGMLPNRIQVMDQRWLLVTTHEEGALVDLTQVDTMQCLSSMAWIDEKTRSLVLATDSQATLDDTLLIAR